VINVESNAPSKETQGHLEATVGNYNTKAFGAAVGGTLIEDRLIGRFSFFKLSSDGYMKNSYLHKDDTNGIDELTVKAALRWFASDNHLIDFNYIHTDIDNGYDAFTLDNSRTSHADQPGQDREKTDAFALKSTYDFEKMQLISKLSYVRSDSLYSYDEDWSYRGEFDAALWPYQGFDAYDRSKEQKDIDLRLLSTPKGALFEGKSDWTIGLYAKQYNEDLKRLHATDYGAERDFSSDYEAKNMALYAQLDTALDEKLKLITGARIEKWQIQYDDSHDVKIDNDEVMTGGKLGIEYQYQKDQLYYAVLSKGYKPGGVNAGTTLSPEEKKYATETLWNLDVGVDASYLDQRLSHRLNFFYGKRKDMQVKRYTVDTHSFTDYLDNAAKGTYYGLESELDYFPTDALHLYSRVGLLHAEFDKYIPKLKGRAPAQSPKYQYDIGFDYSFMDHWIFKADMEGKGGYYFSNTHDQKSKAYHLLNSSLSYVTDNWTAMLWGRNLTNETYDVRGFYFGNNPAKGYADELYTQKGAPRTFGFTLSYDF